MFIPEFPCFFSLQCNVLLQFDVANIRAIISAINETLPVSCFLSCTGPWKLRHREKMHSCQRKYLQCRILPSTYPLSYFYSRETTTYLSIKTGIGSIKCNSNQLTKAEQENTIIIFDIGIIIIAVQGNCSNLRVHKKTHGPEAPAILLISLISNINYFE